MPKRWTTNKVETFFIISMQWGTRLTAAKLYQNMHVNISQNSYSIILHLFYLVHAHCFLRVSHLWGHATLPCKYCLCSRSGMWEKHSVSNWYANGGFGEEVLFSTFTPFASSHSASWWLIHWSIIFIIIPLPSEPVLSPCVEVHSTIRNPNIYLSLSQWSICFKHDWLSMAAGAARFWS